MQGLVGDDGDIAMLYLFLTGCSGATRDADQVASSNKLLVAGNWFLVQPGNSSVVTAEHVAQRHVIHRWGQLGGSSLIYLRQSIPWGYAGRHEGPCGFTAKLLQMTHGGDSDNPHICWQVGIH